MSKSKLEEINKACVGRSITIDNAPNMASLEFSNSKICDYWLKFNTAPRFENINIPIMADHDLKKLMGSSKIQQRFTVTPTHVKLYFTQEVLLPREPKNIVCFDIGMWHYLTPDSGENIGTKHLLLIDKAIKNRDHVPSFNQCIHDLKEAIDKVIYQLLDRDVDFLGMENTANFRNKMVKTNKHKKKEAVTIKKRRKYKLQYMRNDLWLIGYFFNKLREQCLDRNIWLFSVPAYGTSTTCPGGADHKVVRDGSYFKCEHEGCKVSGSSHNIAGQNVKQRACELYLKNGFIIADNIKIVFRRQ